MKTLAVVAIVIAAFVAARVLARDTTHTHLLRALMKLPVVVRVAILGVTVVLLVISFAVAFPAPPR